MNRLWLSSLLGNIILSGLALYLWSINRTSHRPPQPVATVGLQPAAVPMAPFHWQQLESPSYPDYIANLRRVGCPEQTISDIISADLASLFATRRATATAQTADPAERARLMAALEREEYAVRQRLLAPPAHAVAAPPARPATRRQPVTSAPSPALEPADNASLIARLNERGDSLAQLQQLYQGLQPSEVELTLIQDLSRQLHDDFGTAPSTPDPQWDQRRCAAIQDSEDLLRSLLGYQRYNEFLRDAVARQTPGPPKP